jgi:hypothetical protein
MSEIEFLKFKFQKYFAIFINETIFRNLFYLTKEYEATEDSDAGTYIAFPGS